MTVSRVCWYSSSGGAIGRSGSPCRRCTVRALRAAAVLLIQHARIVVQRVEIPADALQNARVFFWFLIRKKRLRLLDRALSSCSLGKSGSCCIALTDGE